MDQGKNIKRTVV